MINPCGQISKVDGVPVWINPLDVEALVVVGLESLVLGVVVLMIGMLCFALVRSVEVGVLSYGAGCVVLALGV